jgi:hypothetical protein
MHLHRPAGAPNTLVQLAPEAATGTGGQWSEIASSQCLGTAWAQNGIKRRQLGTARKRPPKALLKGDYCMDMIA